MEELIEGIRRYGVCQETYWPFNKERIQHQPDAPAYINAKCFALRDVYKVSINEHSMKLCLADGYPFIFCVAVYNSFSESERKEGKVPMPKKEELKKRQPDFHGMLAVGYSNKKQVFIVKNSYGKNWVNMKKYHQIRRERNKIYSPFIRVMMAIFTCPMIIWQTRIIAKALML